MLEVQVGLQNNLLKWYENQPMQQTIKTKKVVRLLFFLIFLFGMIFLLLGYKFKRDLQSQKSAKEDRVKLIELNEKQLQILENK